MAAIIFQRRELIKADCTADDGKQCEKRIFLLSLNEFWMNEGLSADDPRFIINQFKHEEWISHKSFPAKGLIRSFRNAKQQSFREYSIWIDLEASQRR